MWLARGDFSIMTGTRGTGDKNLNTNAWSESWIDETFYSGRAKGLWQRVELP